MSRETKKKALTREKLFEIYDYVGFFHEGFAWATIKGEYFHIYPDGTPAYEERYDFTSRFHEGLAKAKKDGEDFNINHNGKRVD